MPNQADIVMKEKSTTISVGPSILEELIETWMAEAGHLDTQSDHLTSISVWQDKTSGKFKIHFTTISKDDLP